QTGASRMKVRETQMALKNAGFNPGPIDGINGPVTTTARRNYQPHFGLEVTGTLNAETENSLTSGAATAARSKPEPSSSQTQSGDVSERRDGQDRESTRLNAH